MKIGDMVRVVELADETGASPARGAGEPSTARFVGRVGRIVEVNTGRRWKVGNTPQDPLFIVEVPVLGKDGFWAEELEVLSCASSEK